MKMKIFKLFGMILILSSAPMTAFANSVEGGVYAYKQKKYELALSYFQPAADTGNAKAQFYLGKMYHYGRGVDQSYTTAAMWYKKAADQNHAAAATDLGFLHDKGNGMEQSYEKAFYWYRKGAELGNTYGMNNLGYMYYKGRGTPQDYAQAVYWTRKAANLRHPRARWRLGEMYELGRGVTQNYHEARQWYQKAAEQNVKGAKEKVASLEGKVTPGSSSNTINTAFKSGNGRPSVIIPGAIANSACEAGDIDDCWDRYEAGENTSDGTAIEWATIGCGVGNGSLCFNAGALYDSGKYGTPVNKKLSNAYYMRACDERGHKSGCFNAGVQYKNGHAVARNYGLSYNYYHKACLKGDSQGCKERDTVQRLMNSGSSYDDTTVRRANDPNGYLSETGPVCRPRKIIQNGRMHTITECLDRDVAKKRGWVK